MSGRDDVATDEDIIGNAAESKDPASYHISFRSTSPYSYGRLGNVVKSNETLHPMCKSEVHNNNVFEHLMQHFFDS